MLNSFTNQRALLWELFDYFEIPSDGVLLIHSAFKQFALDGFDAQSVLDIFLDYCAAGTLLMPTMSWRYVKKTDPTFSVLRTPSNTGILTEYFRHADGVRRSLHPTHSVAGLGQAAETILSTHHLSKTPCDELSPFGKLVDHNANILMFGVGIDCCTLIHHIEELIAPDIYLSETYDEPSYECFDRSEEKVLVRLRRQLFLPRNYWQFQDALAQKKQMKAMNVGNATCLYFKSSDLKQLVGQRLEKDPKAILSKTGERYRMM